VQGELLKDISTDSTGYIYVPNANMLNDLKNLIVDNDILNFPIAVKIPTYARGNKNQGIYLLQKANAYRT